MRSPSLKVKIVVKWYYFVAMHVQFSNYISLSVMMQFTIGCEVPYNIYG